MTLTSNTAEPLQSKSKLSKPEAYDSCLTYLILYSLAIYTYSIYQQLWLHDLIKFKQINTLQSNELDQTIIFDNLEVNISSNSIFCMFYKRYILLNLTLKQINLTNFQIDNFLQNLFKILNSNQMQKPEQIDIDKIINKLTDKSLKEAKLLQSQVRALCIKSRQIFLSQPMLLELQAPIKICGDIHGQFTDLIKLFQYGGYPGDTNYLFLGDYIDRGKQSIECICLLMAYKIKFPENFFLLRGNHQCSSINRIYGFYDQCKRKYNLKLWKLFSDVFNVMPVSALVDEKIFCMHGGLSPQLQNFEQILKIVRPVEIPDQGLLCDLLWSDPQKGIQGWNENQRGVSFIFGSNVVSNFLKDQDIDLICRAHQVVEEGYEFFAKRQLVTIFSAPNYCGQFDNSGAIMSVDESLMCSFQILKSSKKKK